MKKLTLGLIYLGRTGGMGKDRWTDGQQARPKQKTKPVASFASVPGEPASLEVGHA